MTELHLQDMVRLRKVHPCGSDRWQVMRLGADIGLRCLGCGRRVLMGRSALERRLRDHVTVTDLVGGVMVIGRA